ncbi:MAG: ATP-binding protein [Candidatus Poribacteria bacterium]|nr:ATP-binding protein [Candidatus Poribacteria bacterium]
MPLVSLLTKSWDVPGFILAVYELNGPIRFLRASDREKLKKAFGLWRQDTDQSLLSKDAIGYLIPGRMAKSAEEQFDTHLSNSIGNPTVALELLRQFCLLSRTTDESGEKLLKERLLIVIEAADMLLPEGEIPMLSQADRHRVSIAQDWILDPAFMDGKDAVIFITESKSLMNSRITRLPQVVTVEIPSPGQEERKHFISWFNRAQKSKGKGFRLWGTQEQLATLTAGLSLHALRQLLITASYFGNTLQPQDVIEKVSDFVQGQLGEDVVEFKKPTHSLKDVIGNERLIDFIQTKLLPRLTSTGPDAISGAAVCGPIGSGKTFIFEALAGALDMPVLVLKNIRSMWFGQTDVIFERLKRLLSALVKALIFVDEADTQFGEIGRDAHSTERRLTGKIQAMMSDPQLRGNITWLLMTARIYNLSPDLRREGRVGDVIIPVLDPEGEDRKAFIKWALHDVFKGSISDTVMEQMSHITEGYSAASFASLRSDLRAAASDEPLSIEQIVEIAADRILPDIGPVRSYQTLQALMNCTRKSLLPEGYSPQMREEWMAEIRKYEQMGVGR